MLRRVITVVRLIASVWLNRKSTRAEFQVVEKGLVGQRLRFLSCQTSVGIHR